MKKVLLYLAFITDILAVALYTLGLLWWYNWAEHGVPGLADMIDIQRVWVIWGIVSFLLIGMIFFVLKKRKKDSVM